MNYSPSPHIEPEISSCDVQSLDGVFGMADPSENSRPRLWLEPMMATFYAFMKALFR
jgi:hypothetical protein